MLNKNLTFEEQVKAADRLNDSEGSFISQYPKISIGFLEELCEWVCFHNNMTEDQKIEYILGIEEQIKECLSGGNVSKFAINYIPTWSKYFEKNKSKIEHLVE